MNPNKKLQYEDFLAIQAKYEAHARKILNQKEPLWMFAGAHFYAQEVILIGLFGGEKRITIDIFEFLKDLD